MAITRSQKESILSELKDGFKKSASLVFVKNNGVDVNSLNRLKKELKKGSVDLKVAKKTLIALALKDQGIEDFPETIMDGPIMVAMSFEDQIAAAKALKAFMKGNEKLEFTGGVFGTTVYDKQQVTQLASLPSKEELLSTLLSRLQGPLYGLHNALQYHLRGLVQVLSQIQKQKA